MKQIKQSFKVLIPARLGSKGLKKKNLKKIQGKSLVEIAILNAKKIKYINDNDIFVSTDSKKIISIAKKNKVNFIRRPDRFCKDSSIANDVIIHFKNYLNFKGELNLIYLQPSSPLKTEMYLKKAIFQFIKNTNKTLISGYIENSEKFLKAFICSKNTKPLFNKKFITANRQSFKHSCFIPNGAIFIFKLKKNFRYIKTSIINPLVFPKNAIIDINNLNDFKKAKKLFKK